MTASLTNVQTLSRFIHRDKHRSDDVHRDLIVLFDQIQLACKVVANAIRKDALEVRFENQRDTRYTTTSQETSSSVLEHVSNVAFINALTNSGKACVIVSELEADALVIEESLAGNYVIVIDPLDGINNLECNVSVGSIFAIYAKADESSVVKAEDYLQPGKEMLAAGYALYGSSTLLVISTGNGVNGFTLDMSLGEFVLTHRDISIPERGNIYSVNEGYSEHWNEGVKKFIESIKRKTYKHRYVGSMVSDVHRTLLYGGIFMYPGDKYHLPTGKLRLLYEVNPLAYIIEQAKGKSSNGFVSPLEKVPSSIHQTMPVFLGSKLDVEELEAHFSESQVHDTTAASSSSMESSSPSSRPLDTTEDSQD